MYEHLHKQVIFPDFGASFRRVVADAYRILEFYEKYGAVPRRPNSYCYFCQFYSDCKRDEALPRLDPL